MQMLIGLVGICAGGLICYYVLILMKGDTK